MNLADLEIHSRYFRRPYPEPTLKDRLVTKFNQLFKNGVDKKNRRLSFLSNYKNSLEIGDIENAKKVENKG